MLQFRIWGDGTTAVNVRRGPGYTYAVITSLAYGTAVQAFDTTIGADPAWRKILWQDNVAWVRDDLCGPVGDGPTRPLTEPFGG